MGKRLSKIYTRTGDDGTTGLGDGNRISKTAPRVEAMGDVDELNSLIGLMLTESVPEHFRRSLLGVQHGLFDVGGELSLPGYTLMSPDRASALEVILDELNEALAPLEKSRRTGLEHLNSLGQAASLPALTLILPWALRSKFKLFEVPSRTIEKGVKISA